MLRKQPLNSSICAPQSQPLQLGIAARVIIWTVILGCTFLTAHRHNVTEDQSVNDIARRITLSLPLTTSLTRTTTTAAKSNSVAICVIAKNENRHIVEWAQHHLDLGVDKIYLYDHDSQLPMKPEVEQFIASGKLHYQQLIDYDFTPTEFDNKTHTAMVAMYISSQLYAYRDCLKQHGSKHDWLAFIDVDEFIILKDPKYKYDLPGFMKQYKDFGGLAMQWRFLGSSGHTQPPKEGVRASYTHCLPLNASDSSVIKMIIQPQYTIDLVVHAADLVEGRPMVMEDKQPIKRIGYPGVLGRKGSLVSLYHYYTRSQEEAYAKADTAAAAYAAGKWWPTGRDDETKKGDDFGVIIDHSFIDEVNQIADSNPERCTEALAYVTP